MMSEIYNTLHIWISSIFDENMSLKIWQYIYGSEVISSQSDLVDFLSELLTLGVLFAVLVFVIMAFVAVFKLVFKVITWW